MTISETNTISTARDSQTLFIRLLSDDNRPAWDEFVEYQCVEATFFHLAGWKEVMEKAFGHTAHFMLAERGGVIEGVLPLAHIKSRLFGNSLISTPFCVYGGIAAISDEARARLEIAAVELAVNLSVDHLELRNRSNQQIDWPSKELYVTFRKTISANSEENMQAIPRKQRAMVRKGIKAGLSSRTDVDTRCFFEIYATSVRNLGTPVFTPRLFMTLKAVFGEYCEVLTTRTAEGQPISSVMSFYFRDEVLPYYGGGTPEARRLKGFDFMYWELMQRAAERGVRLFDYGRSKIGTGSYSFKKNWGFEPEPLPYRYKLIQATAIPEVNPLNPKYRLFINAWKRLPLPVANVIGPMISRSLG
jgi:FemAB-related protein (PEP-CTERM system-associated)